MSSTLSNTTPRDLYWVAVYLHSLSDLANQPNLSPTVSKLLSDYADEATLNYCKAQVEADELAQGLDS